MRHAALLTRDRQPSPALLDAYKILFSPGRRLNTSLPSTSIFPSSVTGLQVHAATWKAPPREQVSASVRPRVARPRPQCSRCRHAVLQDTRACVLASLRVCTAFWALASWVRRSCGLGHGGTSLGGGGLRGYEWLDWSYDPRARFCPSPQLPQTVQVTRTRGRASAGVGLA